MNLDKFMAYYDTTNVFRATAQVNAVQIYHLRDATPNYLTSVCATVRNIVTEKPKGNILVFNTAAKEIEEICVTLRDLIPGLRVLPMYSALPKHLSASNVRCLDQRR